MNVREQRPASVPVTGLRWAVVRLSTAVKGSGVDWNQHIEYYNPVQCEAPYPVG